MKTWEYRIGDWSCSSAEPWFTGLRWVVRQYYIETVSDEQTAFINIHSAHEIPHLAPPVEGAVVVGLMTSREHRLLVEVTPKG